MDAIAAEFDIPGELIGVERFERGHIHDTFVSTWRLPSGEQRVLHQRINQQVFTDVAALMHNIERVTAHLAQREARAGMRHLELLPTRAGDCYLRTADGAWRSFRYIENSESHDRCDGPEQAHAAAAAFGGFLVELADLDPGTLRETIPGFFSSRHRLRQFETARHQDPLQRVEAAAAEIAFVAARVEMVDRIDALLATGVLPRRIVHGDTKLNNLLFDRDSKAPLCVVDLDTCMPAFWLYDFGDLVRYAAATAAEDERDLDRVGLDLELYRALATGFREATAGRLGPDEVQLMPFAARLVTFTVGLRFLTDHLLGDRYFKLHRPGHNLDRARAQFRMVEQMERIAAAMQPG